MSQVQSVSPSEVDAMLKSGAVALDIRDKEEHDAGHIDGSLNVSRGKLEMNVEGLIGDLDAVVICYCNANNQGRTLCRRIAGDGLCQCTLYCWRTKSVPRDSNLIQTH